MIHNRKVAAITPLHFGRDYLPYAMRSVADVVDHYRIMFSPVPNHGYFDTSIPCPETQDELARVAFETALDRTRFLSFYDWRSEGEQFMAGWEYTDADVILKLDADECYAPGLLADAIQYGLEERVREVRLPLVHHWRSFRKGFAHDPAAPGRIYFREFPNGEATFATDDPLYKVRHFGYALTLDLMRYKIRTHGHKAEFVNPNWFEEVYVANRQNDCHPCGHAYWRTVEDLEPPAFMMDHPFAELEVIE